MNTKIQEVEEELRELAEATEHAANKLAELRKPKVGDIYATSDCRFLLLGDSYFAISKNRTSEVSMENAIEPPTWDSFTRLGTFDEVYMLRSEADDGMKYIRDWRDSNGFGLDDCNSNNTECNNFIFHFLNGDMDEYEPRPPIF